MFDGKLGTWKTHPVEFKLKEDTKPKYLRPYPVPKVQEEIFEKKVECLDQLGFLEQAKYS